MKTRPFPIPGLAVLTALYFLIAAAAGFRMAVHEVGTSHLMEQIASRQDLNHVTNADVNLNPSRMGVVTSFFLRISQKDIVSRQEAAENQHQIIDEIDQLKAEIRASTGDSVLLASVTILYLLIALKFFEGDQRAPQPRLYALLAVSLIFFAIGISCPVMTAVVKGQHMLIGGFIIQTASKGIISTVLSLFKSGSWPISVLLAGFSIGIPIFKGVAVLVTSLSRSRGRRAAVGRALESIGKWSLTDVLVAAILLGCFSLNAIQEQSGGVFAVPRLALGFFIFYCVLAARTSFLLRRSGEAIAVPPPPAISAVVVSGLVVVLGLGGGLALGYKVHRDLPFRDVASEPALIKLIRTHTELMNQRYRASGGRTTAVGLDLPFAGLLQLDVQARAERKLNVWLEKEAVDNRNQPLDQPGTPVPAFHSTAVSHYRLSGRLAAGKYQLLVEPEAAGLLGGGTGFTVHASLDP